MGDKINIISVNIQGLKGRVCDVGVGQAPRHILRQVSPLVDSVLRSKPDVILLQEINVIQNTLTRENFPYDDFPHYHVYLSRNLRSGIMIKETLASKQLDIIGLWRTFHRLFLMLGPNLTTQPTTSDRLLSVPTSTYEN